MNDVLILELLFSFDSGPSSTPSRGPPVQACSKAIFSKFKFQTLGAFFQAFKNISGFFPKKNPYLSFGRIGNPLGGHSRRPAPPPHLPHTPPPPRSRCSWASRPEPAGRPQRRGPHVPRLDRPRWWAPAPRERQPGPPRGGGVPRCRFSVPPSVDWTVPPIHRRRDFFFGRLASHRE